MKIKTVNFFILLCSLLCFTQQSNAQCHPDDYTALRALYLATDGDNWTNNNGWDVSNTSPPTGCDVCSWFGVTCENGRVMELVLGRNQLTGSIPAELGNLSNLKRIDFWVNELTGSIPAELGNLSNLEQLSLGFNQLSGTIPAELGNLANLTNLNFNSNQLSGTIPAELGNLVNLSILVLLENQLTGSIPAELGNLSSIEQLQLSSNQLSGTIPTELGNLSNLVNLSLTLNQLSGSIPVELSNLSNLTGLFLSGNQLTGTIPAELGNLSNLTGLLLWGNELTGTIPTELGNLSNLVNLSLSSNQLSGSIPVELSNLSNLTGLFLSRNQLTGTIPAELGNLSNLEQLSLGFNQLSGTIPAELGNLSNLDNLSLSSNQLSGSIPVELSNLTNLSELVLNSNQLTGTIPTELGNLINLEILWLYSNQLEGCIPNSLNIFCEESINVIIGGGNPNLDEQDFSAFCSSGSGKCDDNSCPAPCAELTCETFTATGLPLSIDSGAPNQITSTLTVPISTIVKDVRIRNLNGQHTWLSDLTFTLTSPNGTTINLIDHQCSDLDDFSLDLEDSGLTTLNCPYNDGLSYKPANSFQNFIGEDSQGDWVLTVIDNANGDGGSLDGWSIEICFVDECPSFLDITDDYNNETITQQAETIEADNTILNSADVSYKASDCILLQANFTVTANAEFTATIEDCSPSTISPPTEDFLVTNKLYINSTLSIYPNPLNDKTTIAYALENASAVQMQVVDMFGRQVATLVEHSIQPKGLHQVTFNRGQLRGGSYFVILQKGDQYESQKLILAE